MTKFHESPWLKNYPERIEVRPVPAHRELVRAARDGLPALFHLKSHRANVESDFDKIEPIVPGTYAQFRAAHVALNKLHNDFEECTNLLRPFLEVGTLQDSVRALLNETLAVRKALGFHHKAGATLSGSVELLVDELRKPRNDLADMPSEREQKLLDQGVAITRRLGDASITLTPIRQEDDDGLNDPPCAKCQNKEHGADECPHDEKSEMHQALELHGGELDRGSTETLRELESRRIEMEIQREYTPRSWGGNPNPKPWSMRASVGGAEYRLCAASLNELLDLAREEIL